MQYGIVLAVVAYQLALGLFFWFRARKKSTSSQSENEFVLAGKSLPLSLVAITLAHTVLGSPHILGVFEMSWFMGAIAVWFSIAHVMLLILICLTTGRWVRRMGVITVT